MIFVWLSDYHITLLLYFYSTCWRSHEIAEIAGLIALSYGEEGVDRYIVVYKRDNPPSDDEVAARRDGSEWNESIASEYRANVYRRIFRSCAPLNIFSNAFPSTAREGGTHRAGEGHQIGGRRADVQLQGQVRAPDWTGGRPGGGPKDRNQQVVRIW